jgi:hypothetical protein
LEETLQLHRDLASRGRFGEADNALERAAELKLLKTKAVEREVKEVQIEQKEDVEAQHWNEFHDFHLRWEKLVREESKASKEAIAMLEASHKSQTEAHLQKLNNTLPTRPKPSAHLLNLKRQMEASIRTLKYKAAHDFQRDINVQEQRELESFLGEREEKLKAGLAALKHKQELEMLNLKKRLNSSLQELKVRKKAETEAMLQRYKNYSTSLHTAQSIQLNILTGKHTTLAGKHNPSRSLSLTRSPDDMWAGSLK